MFVTNKTDRRLGLDGVTVLRPLETNFHIEDTDKNRVACAERLKAHGLVSIVYEDGLTKVAPGIAVKTVGIDEGALSEGPRSKVKDQAKPVVEAVAVKEDVAEEATVSKKTTKRVSKKAAEAKTTEAAE